MISNPPLKINWPRARMVANNQISGYDSEKKRKERKKQRKKREKIKENLFLKQISLNERIPGFSILVLSFRAFSRPSHGDVRRYRH